MIRVAITGASGRMGLCLIKATVLAKEVTLSVVTTRINSVSCGKDAGDLAGIGCIDISVSDHLEKMLDQFDVLIDFTHPESSMQYIELCRQAGKKIVIGTTGHNEIQKAQIIKTANEIAIVLAPNMSVGVNLALKLLEMTAKVMGDYTDIEVIEAHHRHKIDAPSGTALCMGKVVADVLGRDLKDCAIYGREGNTGERERKTIGFSTIRAGDIVGEHTVMFADSGERVEITHKATNRMTFANGAVRAAVWLESQDIGLYDMQDVLGLNNSQWQI